MCAARVIENGEYESAPSRGAMVHLPWDHIRRQRVESHSTAHRDAKT